MSHWTTVTGIIRLDGVPEIFEKDTIENILEIFGPIYKGDGTDKVNYKDIKLPKGSEGSLQYQLIEYGEGFPWLVIPIWGDLRDFTDINIIITWWENLINELNYGSGIRSAILVINNSIILQ